MTTGGRDESYGTHKVVLEVDGVPIGAFSEVGGLNAESDIVDYREGSELRSNVRKLTGVRRSGSITLKRGYSLGESLWGWHDSVLNRVAERRNATIVLLDEQRETVCRWNLGNAWISRIEGPGLSATAHEVAIESLELTHEGLTLET